LALGAADGEGSDASAFAGRPVRMASIVGTRFLEARRRELDTPSDAEIER
jgi:hypothetical protein